MSGAGSRTTPDAPAERVGRTRAGARRALFGIETRYVTRVYLQRVFIVGAAVLAIVLSLDLATNLAWVMSEQSAAAGREGFARLAFYLGLRAAYNLPAIVPIAAVIGVVWAEFGLAAAHERIMIFNSGRAPVRSLMPALLVGILLGLTQFAALSYARPLSVEEQARSGFRDFGPRYRAGGTTGHKWIAIEDGFVHARIDFGPPVSLRDVMVYGLGPDGRLDIVVSAERARPTGQAGLWQFAGGSWWERPPAGGGQTGGVMPVESAFELAEISLPLDPLWVDYSEVPARFLPQPVVRALAAGGPGVPEAFGYRTNYQERLAAFIHPLAMTLLGATLCLIMLRPRVPPLAPLTIGMAGYAIHVASKILSMLGEYGYIPPVVAAWTLPLAVAAGCLLLLHLRDRRVRRALAARIRP